MASRSESFAHKRAMIAIFQDKKSWPFIKAFHARVSIKAAAKAIGIDKSRHYDWLKNDPAYRAAWETVQDQAAQSLEDEAVRRAFEGVKRMRTHQGRPVKDGRGKIVYDVEYDSALLLALLKRYRPHLYRERVETQVTGTLEIVERIQQGRQRLLEMKRDDASAAG
jgi:hypothetical protein